ncbi:transmembrane protein 79-like [Conger conger]|uniref:transmembrane protein 79-like n=1 Tax=Conger conger TaxID=82655 RepID=UPI002A59E90D|nr:transmembrane protein 79-like [Conger conger]
MPEIMSHDLEPDSKTSGVTAEPQTLPKPEHEEENKVEGKNVVKGEDQGEDEENKMEEEEKEDEEEAVSSALLEPSTLQWPENKEREVTGGAGFVKGEGEEEEEGAGAARAKETEAENGSVESLCTSAKGQESRTESDRELERRDRESVEGWMELEKEMGMKEEKKPNPFEIEVEEGDALVNSMPEKAAGVFSHSVTILHSSSKPESPGELWRGDPETAPFLGPHATLPNDYYDHWTKKKSKCGCCGTDRAALKVGVSVFTAGLIFPLLVWGGYVFLPFDAPLLNSAALRLIYTLRCSIFATVPIILGMFVLGVSRLRFGAVKALCEGEEESREVRVHRQYISDSISLFLLYFLQLGIMATYLSQELLKLVPLLTIIFAFGRLIYWMSMAMGSSVRGVGFGFSFLPILAMLGANLYFMFMLDAGGSIFAMEGLAAPEPEYTPRQRYWG